MRALVVGSNRGGPGQADLRFAEDDARRFAEVLVEMGGYSADSVRLLTAPGRDELLAALARVREELTAQAERGDSSVFTFFYSGHARASALSLGPDELALPELRKELLSLPATVTVAILDACQTGAISQIKGAQPAADFSVNSVFDLNAAGAAIMASSTASELSQESDRLRSSYFTHHLLSGLRGAADADGDGRVTLSEAYRYAYNHTLVATASTAVGRQHVTLENDLKGKGEMVLTWPEKASAHLQLPAGLAAEVVIQKNPGGSVVAEVSKVSGDQVRLGLPPGSYSAFVKTGRSAKKCELDLTAGASTELAPERCAAVPVEETTAKSDDRLRTAWGLELGVGVLRSRADGYSRRLGAFGFDGGSPTLSATASLAATRAINRYFSVGLRFDVLELTSAQRQALAQGDATRTQTFDWKSFGLGAFVRAGLPLFDGVLTPYLQVGGGLSLGTTHYRDDSGSPDDRQTFVGFELAAQAGLEVMPWSHFGFFGQVGYAYAPAIKDLLGDVHDSGGVSGSLGVRGAF
jgi:hypothetical protein